MLAKRTVEGTTWQLQDAKARLSEVVQNALEGRPQVISRRGRDEVVVLRRSDYESALHPKETLVELFRPVRGADADFERRKDTSRGFES